MHNFIGFNLRNLAFVFVKPGGACKFFKTKIIYSYQGEVTNAFYTYGVANSSCSSSEVLKIMSSAWKFDSSISLVNP